MASLGGIPGIRVVVAVVKLRDSLPLKESEAPPFSVVESSIGDSDLGFRLRGFLAVLEHGLVGTRYHSIGALYSNRSTSTPRPNEA